MGLIRFLLAISVVIAHVGAIYGFTLIGGKIAVQSFFILSGFYMALILNEKYAGHARYFLFLRNRFLRIYPLYFVILTITFILSIFWANKGMFGPFTFYKDINMLSPLTLLYLIIENIVILGQDVGMFLDITHKGMLFFSPTLSATKPFVYNHLLIPQAWTLSIEFMFYALAPFFVKSKTKALLIFILASLSLRLFLNSIGLHHEPWINKFFPTELVFFLAGILSYRIYKKIEKKHISQKLFIPAYLVFLGFTLFYNYIPSIMNSQVNALQWTYFLSLVLLAPHIFSYFKNYRFDRFLGDLSYPIYLSHVLVFYGITNLNLHVDGSTKGAVSIILTILFSFVLFKTVISYFERFRGKGITRRK